ncbi:MAG: hypothetical protein RL385_2494, partial [Pseudomonadota bacterium]
MKMMRMSARAALAYAVMSSALAACHHRDGRESAHHEQAENRGDKPELGSGLSTSLAVYRITHARCEREARCDNIGAGKRYESTDLCEERTKHEWADDLNKYECPHGIKEAKLEACLKDMRAEPPRD